VASGRNGTVRIKTTAFQKRIHGICREIQKERTRCSGRNGRWQAETVQKKSITVTNGNEKNETAGTAKPSIKQKTTQ